VWHEILLLLRKTNRGIIGEGAGMSDVVFYICILIAIILCAGTPDLLDAITAYVLSLSKVCP
jgi:hypothetical protein